MILVILRASIFDCYVQRVLIQMGLLKSIKYLMFDMPALNEIVDKIGWLKDRNEHLFYELYIGKFWIDLGARLIT